MDFKLLRFANRHGHRLAAQLDLPVAGNPHAYAIFAHCFTCTKNLKAVTNINESLTRHGIAVLRFDFTGLGQSEGDFSETGFTTNVSDLIDAAQYMAKHYKAPQILIGHSLGGAAVLQAAAEIESARAIAVIGAPSRTDHILKHLPNAEKQIMESGEAEVRLIGRPFKIKKQFLDDLKADQMKATLKSLGRALLILHSPVDNIVGVDNASEIFMAARHPKSFVSLDTADHLLSDPADSRYAGSLIAAWSSRYTGMAENGKPLEHPGKSPVTISIGTGYTTEITAGTHAMIADEPESAGGADKGPTPYDYLVAGLGACKAITMRMYADRKKWPLDAARISLSHDKLHADDCRDCETRKGYLDEIEGTIFLEGELSTDQRQRIAEIADKCPVHRTLKGEIRIKTTLK